MSSHPALERPAFKRGRSDLSRSATPVLGDSDGDEARAKLPPFLRQSPIEIERKFQRIQDHEDARKCSADEGDEDNPHHPWALDFPPEALSRNRYGDVTPWSNFRVRLKVPAGDLDYINASPISLLRSDGHRPLQYIACQGPKRHGVDHFWQMVWHECGQTAVVIMLTRLAEGSPIREKCFQYYPSEAPMLQPRSPLAESFSSAGNRTPTRSGTLSPTRLTHSSHTSAADLSTATQPSMNLTLTSDDGQPIPATLTLVDTTCDIEAQATVRKLSLTCRNEPRMVYHLSFAGWPDHGAPVGRDRAALLALIRLSNSKNDGEHNESPRIVHCSAGVGRTGTFIALEHLLGELDIGGFDDVRKLEKHAKLHEDEEDEDEIIQTWPDPVFEVVSRLREQRPMMVQNLVQMSFIYEILAEEWLKRYKRLAEETKLMAEPSPKALRLGRGLKKMLHLGKEKLGSVRREETAEDAKKQDSLAAHKVSAMLEYSRILPWALIGGSTCCLVVYLMSRRIWKH